MATMESGYSAEGKGLVRVLAYVSFQELATRIAHRNTGRIAGEPVADRLMARISADENLHMVFYRDLIRAAFEIDPDQAVVAVAAEVLGFRMPGTGIPNFGRKSVQIAKAGIYNLRIHRDEVIAPILRHWKVFETTFTAPEAQQAQTELATHIDLLEQLAQQYEERLEAQRERVEAGQAAS
jgi:acyl-[acyl-carrier-protein] desaturase